MDATQARKMCEEFLNTIYVRRELERMKEYYDENVVSHPEIPGIPPGLTGVKAMAQAWLEAFSDVGVTLESFTHEQGHVTTRYTVTGRHTGAFMGIAPTGRRISIVDNPRYRLENGKITEFWHTPDLPALMQQLS